MFGSFYQPKEVIIDINTLKTLPKEEIRNGIAEIIKYGVTQDSRLFSYTEKNFSKRNDEFYLNVIERSCRIKVGIIEKDEKEGELRKILNYGHTVGHAIEVAENYKISHGEAIGLGMVYEGKISTKLGLLGVEELEAQNQLIKSIGLPVTYGGNVDNLIEIMKRDKKNKNEELYFILPEEIGSVKEEAGQVSFPVEEFLIRECLQN
jgi:3-dehydroquinate synthase